ncbi:1-acyl-sn-glycerol-3-phosphate acyltransferase [Parafrankia irregularis]|uniref:1-acyl-sn-glycerol-3-phosphate acyltransferase n=1 Tax=Parafrankia irregularis TaxID=795642 RepID=A0A0S4QRU2_9ACTN|nr:MULTISPECIES: lysophospholipid acyltransferase family protein [Parafrankia]MBE3201857.1 1-acyl-sn-glycerol-3-phosphate acyltransferase [Parafrankia sp. CH37]CUU58341.1 1-acyl-sn-glycerol-3-phosphate acyltransferase [Parafrankia irregularis]
MVRGILLIGPYLRLLGRPTITGAENIPPSGPVVLASNHLAVADSFFLVWLIPRRVTFLAKQEYFTGRGLRGRLVGLLFRAAGQVPVDRSGGTAAAAARRAGAGVLSAGGAWGVYPEGTRSPDGRLHKGRTGVARVALATGAPVVPVVMTGTERVSPRGCRRWRRGKVHITVCPPLDFSRYRDLLGPAVLDLAGPASPHQRAVTRSVTDELMRVLAQNSAQEYVDAYAANHRKPEEPAA